MKIPFIVLAAASIVFCQTKAITDNGSEVVLYNDGTWKYVSLVDSAKIDTNPTPFEKSKTATFLVRSKNGPVGFWINPRKWKFERNEESGAEYAFESKDQSVFATVFVEKLDIPLMNLRNIAIENAKDAAPDVRIVHEELRTVNGNLVLMLEMRGTIQGINFTYINYYMTEKKCAIQLVTYQVTSGLDENRKKAETFLNGLVLLD